MRNAEVCDADVVNLNVGGTILSTLRSTLLVAPEGSVFHGMFRGSWSKSRARDGQGNPFLDFTPKLFGKILSYLRTIAISPKTGSLELPIVAPEDDQEFTAMIRFLGIADLFTSQRLLVMQACEDRVQISPLDSGVQLTKRGPRSATAVGRDPLPEGETWWKVTMRELSDNPLVAVGVTSNPSPEQEGYSDGTSFVWAGSGYVYKGQAGRAQEWAGGWDGWQAGDVAILRFDSTLGVLKMYHRRLERMLQMVGLPVGMDYRLRVDMRRSGDRVELSRATSAEAKLVR